MKIFSTLSGQKEEFKPHGDTVTMYVCGVNPYADAHIGHAMSYIIFDVVRRYLEFRGYKVKHVENITDIEDNIINYANRQSISVRELTEKFTIRYFEDMDALNILRPHFTPKATETIPEIIGTTHGLIDRGYAYEAKGSVYFRVTKMSDYGKLSHRTLDMMEAGARIEPGEEKQHPMDFVLWKAAKPGEPSWDSPWGKGRPGWHIECSAMSIKFLGEQIDIHGGGQDLIFPHHENEIAQSECFTGKKPFVKYWMHNGLLQMGAEKMSKSLGNLITIRNALQKFSADGIRLFILGSHYRNPLTYSEVAIEAATGGLRRLIEAKYKTRDQYADTNRSILEAQGIKTDNIVTSGTYYERFITAMDDDFNTPQALATIFNLASEINRAYNLGHEDKVVEHHKIFIKLVNVLGFILPEPENNQERAFTASDTNKIVEVGVLAEKSSIPDDRRKAIQQTIERIQSAVESSSDLTEVYGLITLLKEVREVARKQRNFELADRIRRGLDDAGIMLEDTPQGTVWKRKK